MIRALYSLAVAAAQPLLRRKLRRRGVAEPGYLEHVEERFGHYGAPAQPGSLWIHAVSLGETRAAAILLDALRRERPALRVLLTHGTATGRAEGRKLLREGDLQAWLPWDTRGAVDRFLEHFKPCAGVLMETEVWPNLTAACRARGTPLMLANARFSEKSLAKTLRLAILSRPAYAALSAVWAQTEADARRLAQAGATVKGVFGNLKFDAAPDAAQLERARQWRAHVIADEAAPAALRQARGEREPAQGERESGHGEPQSARGERASAHGARRVVMFASSREGEEAEFLRALPRDAGVQWLVVPRHPQRFDEVAALVREHGLTVSRRSTWVDAPEIADVWIGDSLGEMALYYGLSDAALLGGSFAPLGGQNLIEAAACGCPVVMGPHTFNFAEAALLAEEAGAAFRVAAMAEGVARAVSIAASKERDAIAERCLLFAAAHRGAAAKTAAAVLAIVDR